MRRLTQVFDVSCRLLLYWCTSTLWSLTTAIVVVPHRYPLKHCSLYIYLTNISTEYFKHGIYSPFFSLQNAVCFIILTYLVPVLFTFYIQGKLKLKKKSGAKRLMLPRFLNNTSLIKTINVRPSACTDCIIVPCVVKHHVVFPGWRPTLPVIQTKYPVRQIVGLRDSIELFGTQTGTPSGNVRAPMTRCMNRWRACWSSCQHAYRSQNKKNNSYKLWAEKVRAGVSEKHTI